MSWCWPDYVFVRGDPRLVDHDDRRDGLVHALAEMASPGDQDIRRQEWTPPRVPGGRWSMALGIVGAGGRRVLDEHA